MLSPAHQRTATLLGLLLASLTAAYHLLATRPLTPAPANPTPHPTLTLRLDPNSAPESDLASLPGMGKSRARTLITHRTRLRSASPPIPTPFRSITDLDPLPTFGPQTLRKLEPYLTFPHPAEPPVP